MNSGSGLARGARFRRFHCCRCNLILEFRNKKLLPSCATDVTSISRSSVLPPEYLQALSNEHVQAVIVDGMFCSSRRGNASPNSPRVRGCQPSMAFANMSMLAVLSPSPPLPHITFLPPPPLIHHP